MNRKIIHTVLVATALLAGGSATYAESVNNVVTTRSDQNIQQQYGRDSVYAFSPDAKPLKPDQMANGGGFDKVKSYGAEAWQKTEDTGQWVWDHTLGYFFK
jgi:hypothetical protein